VRTLFRRDDLNSLLPFGELHSLGLPGETYKLAFTPALLTKVFQRPVDGQPLENLLPAPASVLGGQASDQGGYLRSQTLKADGRFPATDLDDHWWEPSGQSYFTTNPGDSAGTELAHARQHFFLPRRYRDQFGQDSSVDFDANDLLAVENRDAAGNGLKVQATDYRVLKPRLVDDQNDNQSEFAFDLVGMLAGTALMGKPLPAPVEGDSLAGFVVDLTQAQLDAFVDAPDPHTGAGVLLQNATTRFVYDFHRFRRTQQANPNDPTQWRPVGAVALARETHFSETLPPQGLRISLSFSYSDGFGREIQKKMEAEPGPVVEGGAVVNPRWVGSGWIIFNNKGKRVRKYEPFFSATHRFEFGITVGVSPILFYDPADRVIAILHPNHSYEKVIFDPWQQDTYDVNDTCAPRNLQTGDPRTDPDIKGQVARYFATLPASPPWQTWHAQRIGGALGPHEQTAANRAAAHADTPTTAHFDTLGRPFLTVSRNRVVSPGHDLDGTENSFRNRVDLDIEGNERVIRDTIEQAGDSLGRIVMRYDYDMLSNRIHEFNMEAGHRWTLNDVKQKPIRTWDSRGHNFTTSYDVLRRKLEERVRGTTAASDPRTLGVDILVEKIEYGESVAGAEALNLRSQIYRHFDSAGVMTNARLNPGGNPVEAYDFKGNLLRTTRQFVTDYTAIPDWAAGPTLNAERFEGGTRYDALNHPIQSIAPHSNVAGTKVHVIQPLFNEGDLLERVDVWLEQTSEPLSLLDPATDVPSAVGVANIDFNAKGQRRRIDYKNGTSTFYRYDPLTFRLTHLYTRRGAAFTDDCNNPTPPPDTFASPDTPPPGETCGLQNLRYTYDPAGNITHIEDVAQQAIYFRNKLVEPGNDYTYDALYRLIQATGREHLGLTAGVANPPTAPDAFNAFHIRLDHRANGNAMGTYIERYVYDGVGNVLEMQHRGSDPAHAGWTRAYDYDETSLLEDGHGGTLLKQSNRLTRTILNPTAPSPQPEPYEHDSHGNIVRMPHLGSGAPGPNMRWDYKDHLQQTDLGGGGTAYYGYDASGERVRKVWEKSASLTEERIYLGGFEIFRRHAGAIGPSSATLERETLHVMDDKQRIALIEMRTLDTAGTDPAPARLIRYQLGNHLGSACLELDHQAQIISYEEYAPYGSSTYQAVRSQTETPKRYRYSGKERDEETGLSYYGARYCACWLARWVSADPGGLIDGPNLYRFARDNPIVLIDPDGKQPAPDIVNPETIAIAATALQRAAAAWGTAGIISGGAAATAPAAAPALLPGVAPAAAAAPELAAGFLVAAQVAAAAAMALTVRLHMQRAGSIARYGNPYGMPARDIAFPAMRAAQQLRAEPFPVPVPPPVPAPNPAPDEQQRRPRPGRIYVTYTKYNSITGRTYSGRTSAVIDLNLPWRPQAEAAMRARDANHHVDERGEPSDPGFRPADLDQFTVGYAVNYEERYRDVGYLAIRGREQQLIDYHGRQRHTQLGLTTTFNGGARTDTNPGTPLTENTFRGVAKENPLGEVFHQAANLQFGELAPFTGYRVQAAGAP
jgi:RHS repeat-associated protein